MIRVDRSSNTNRERVCIHYKESLCVRKLIILYICECILCEVQYKIKKDTLPLFIHFQVKIILNLIF